MPEVSHKNIHKKGRRVIASFISEYKFEITISLMISTGIFLLVEKMEIKAALFRWLIVFLKWSAFAIKRVLGFVVGVLRGIETSDLVGIFLILTAVFLILWRRRSRMILRHPLLETCPECGKFIMRGHRSWKQRILGLLIRVDIRNYYCGHCFYTGMGMKSIKY